MAAKLDIKIIIIGTEKEEPLINAIAGEQSDKIEKSIGKSLKENMELIASSQLLVCNNSGLLHIANALDIPTVSTMGPTNATRWWPLGQNNIVIRKEIECIGCNNNYCKINSHDCMELITVDEMVEAVQKSLLSSKMHQERV